MRRCLQLLPLVALSCVLMTGCTRGPDNPTLTVEVGSILRDEIRLRLNKAKAPQPPTLTRALLETIKDPHIEVVIEDVDLRDYLTLQLRRQDDLPGEIEVWRTIDNITFSFRDGMLIATRGLRGTLLSAEVPADGQGGMGPARGGPRLYEIRADDSASVVIHMACELEDLGIEQLEIVELTYSTRHVREHCLGPKGGRITNDYWIDSQSGRLWQSRQWAGPDTGYIRTRQVVI